MTEVLLSKNQTGKHLKSTIVLSVRGVYQTGMFHQ